MSLIDRKRRPGRPPSNTKQVKTPRNGILAEPLNEENAIEFYYTMPIIFKKLFALYKNTGVQNITIQFEKERVIFYGISFSEQITICTIFEGAQLHRYYCYEEARLELSRDAADRIINRIDDKFFDSISFNVKHYTNEIESIEILLNNPKLNSISKHKLNLSSLSELLVVDEDKWDNNKYPLSITFDRQNLKKYVSDIEYIASILTIEKVCNYPVKFKYVKEGNILSCVDSFNDSDAIHLKSTMGENDIIAASINIEEVKHISSIQLADYIEILVDNTRDLMFRIEMDLAVVTKILLKIENYRDKVKK